MSRHTFFVANRVVGRVDLHKEILLKDFLLPKNLIIPNLQFGEKTKSIVSYHKELCPGEVTKVVATFGRDHFFSVLVATKCRDLNFGRA